MFDDCYILKVMDYYHIKLNKAGFALCPFHSEKTPSFHVNNNLFYCFGCNESGNAITFIKKMENCDTKTAIDLLGKICGIDFPKQSMSSRETMQLKRRKLLYDVNKFTGNHYYMNLREKNNLFALNYLKEVRQLSDETIKSFALGFSSDNNSLIDKIKEKNMEDDIKYFEELGILNNGKNGFYEKFKNRIIIPILDVNDNLIGFGGRIIEGDGAKYLNSKESELFHKGDNLYALNKAKKSPILRKDKYLFLCEGYMDVISMHQAGFDNTIASLGTSLTENQAKLLKKYTSNVILLYDSDEAGINATLRAIDILLANDITPKVLRLDTTKDPDEYIKTYGKESFSKLIKKAMGYLEYEIYALALPYDLENTSDLKKYIDVIFDRMRGLKNSLEIELCFRLLSKKTMIDINILKADYNGEGPKIVTNTKIKTFVNEPENHGKSWTDEEIEQLKQEIKERLSISIIAQKHKRTENAIWIMSDKILHEHNEQ